MSHFDEFKSPKQVILKHVFLMSFWGLSNMKVNILIDSKYIAIFIDILINTPLISVFSVF